MAPERGRRREKQAKTRRLGDVVVMCDRWPRENRADRSGSPCSPPWVWEIMCASPVALCQM